MIVTALVHLYPPTHNAGAEWMLHATLTDLRERHDITPRVIVNRPPRRWDWLDGVEVRFAKDARAQRSLLAEADVIVTHLDATRTAMMHAQRLRTPLVHLVHNDAQLAYHSVTPADCQLAVFNSRWVGDAHAWPGEQMVLHPPVWLDRYQVDTSRADAVTLLNMAERKGSGVFYDLAERFPDRRFVGVRGSYAAQDLRRAPNVELLANQADVRRVYRETRVLLMPSHYESWGRCAVEAAASSVPTLAADTPGLRETGIPWRLLPHDDVDAWAAELAELDDPGTYAQAGACARVEAERLELLTRGQVDVLAARLVELAGKS